MKVKELEHINSNLRVTHHTDMLQNGKLRRKFELLGRLTG